MGDKITDKYKHCNHYHELKDYQTIVNFGTGEFVADKQLLPLLKALNDSGLETRSHCGHTENKFVCIRMDNITSITLRDLSEPNSSRKTKPGKEIVICWKGGQKTHFDKIIEGLVSEIVLEEDTIVKADGLPFALKKGTSIFGNKKLYKLSVDNGLCMGFAGKLKNYLNTKSEQEKE